MPRPTNPADTVEITLADGQHVTVHAVIAGRVRGIDADGDLLVPLGDTENPIRHDDGSEYLIPLTPCCHASGKGSESPTGVVCRGCYRPVDGKYGGPGFLAIARA
ncbi:hypothetical protein GCM10027258_80280 [Amycolatopsis stemonae]